MNRRFLLGLLSLGLSGVAAAGERYYAAELSEARWTTQTSRLECSLSHQIPAYGTATFYRKGGGDLRFSLQVLREPAEPRLAKLDSAPPAWNHKAALRDLGHVTLVAGKVPFTFERALSMRLLSELESGMVPTLSYRDWSDGRDDIQVRLLAVNFRNALKQFISCVEQLLPYDFNAVRLSNLPFSKGETELEEKHKHRLDQIAEYVLADKEVLQIEIDAYTDKTGFRKTNREVTEQRAAAIRDYLVAAGLPEKMFVLRAHGEKEARYSNRTPKGRAMNRRTTIMLVK